MKTRSKVLTVLVPATLAACAYGGAPLQFEMSQHLGRARAMYTAILYDELEYARESARLIADSDPSPRLPDGSASLADAVRRAARTIADATTLREAARATGPLAQRCVMCHERYAATPRLPTLGAPPGKSALGGHMSSYRWSVDRLWEGLMTGSDARWDAGIAGLLEPPLDAETLRSERGQQAAESLRRVAEVAERAESARSAAARAEAFGRTLEVCVACHDAARGWSP